ncbi:voltage-dependent T-type calcium channel subunit alpha-1I-like [Pempheris klunzingeri]|uniref:voltage-dependent T-type calcium channel subunit alpha-1I-like n=1 Tax=Pempheris klunzingeri TaxID=3127111 RepID=UPI00397EC528
MEVEQLPYPRLARTTLTPSSTWLNLLSALTALLNCYSLGMYEPCGETSPHLEVVEHFIFGYFVIEMLIKMVSLGFFGYIRNNWNKLDILVICADLLNFCLVSLGILLPFSPVLRPLRLISRVPSMRNLVKQLGGIMSMLANVLFLYFFVIHVFAVVGVQLWAGKLLNRCFLGEDIPTMYNVSLSSFYMTKYNERSPFICAPDNDTGTLHCHDVPPYRVGGETCSLPAPHRASAASVLVPTVEGTSANGCVNWNVFYNTCRTGDRNPHMGNVNFDNIGFSWLAIFQVVTLEGWTEIMNYTIDAQSLWTCAFFIVVTIMGSFIIMNVCAVIIATQFLENTDMDAEELCINPDWTTAIYNQLTSCWTNFPGLICRTTVHPNDSNTRNPVVVHTLKQLQAKVETAVNSKYFKQGIMLVVFLSVVTLAVEHHGQPKELTTVMKISNWLFTAIFVLEFAVKLFSLQMLYFKDRNNTLDFFIVVVSLLGMHLFGGNNTITHKNPFDSLLWSMVTVFQTLTQEDWNLVLYNTMTSSSPWAALYFTTVIVFGKHVILNILVGIVVQSFQARRSSGTNQDLPIHPVESMNQDNQATGTDPANPTTKQDNVSRCLNCIDKPIRWFKQHEDWSLFMFSPQNKFRLLCQRIVSRTWFDNMILLFILLSCIAIAVERPGIDPTSVERWILTVSRYLFSVVFMIEMFVKVVAAGFLFGKETYCRDTWNAMDGLLVILSIVHMVFDVFFRGKGNMLGMIKVLRLLRTLRPLRVIKRAPKLKLAMEALITSMKPLRKIVLICLAFFLFYSILGVQLFKGKFFYCVGKDTRNITNKAECLSANYHWERKVFNFDNLPQALMSIFVMYSKDGWVNIMQDGLDAVGVDRQPVRNHNKWMLLFFIPFMVMSFFLLDTFIGVMVEAFHDCQQEQKRKDAELLRQRGPEMLDQGGGKEDGGAHPEELEYWRHYSPMRQAVFRLCNSSMLDLFMTAIIIINVLIMAIEHYNQPEYIGQITEYSFYAFTVILVMEIVLKIVAFGVKRFRKSSWNLLDLLIVGTSIISILLAELKMANAIPNPSILRVLRVLRLANVLRAKKIRVLLKTIIKTLAHVGSMCLLFMFFFFIYAALGVELFGRLECTPDYPCVGLNRHANFHHFGMALLTLYQICTGDNWSGIMKDTLRKCRPGDEGCSSHLYWIAPITLITFVVMAQFVLVNLVVAAIMQALEDSNKVASTNSCPPSEEEELQAIEEGRPEAPSPTSSA